MLNHNERTFEEFAMAYDLHFYWENKTFVFVYKTYVVRITENTITHVAYKIPDLERTFVRTFIFIDDALNFIDFEF